jgi:hypothetical protein
VLQLLLLLLHLLALTLQPLLVDHGRLLLLLLL